MVWYGMVYDMVWYVMVWHGMVYGMVYGMVWYGVYSSSSEGLQQKYADVTSTVVACAFS